MNAGKKPAQLSKMNWAHAAGTADGVGWHTRPGLPPSLVLSFQAAAGPPILNDGRALLAIITPAELAQVLGALPALVLDNDEDAAALLRVARMLRGEARS